MEPAEPRIVVMRPGDHGAAAVLLPHGLPHDKPRLISGHDVLLYVARGHGHYQSGRQTVPLRPHSLIAAPAGSFECELDDEDHEVYIVALREQLSGPNDARGFMPAFERLLAPRESREWHERMAHTAWLIDRGRFGADDVHRFKSELAPLMWQNGAGSRGTLHAVFDYVWERLDEPLSLDGLGREVGYSGNYLNDLARAQTGRPLGRWIADMRMSRARSYLEQTDVAIADVGAGCGYDDPAYFSRAFRREHGVSPATWRIAARPEDARFGQVALRMDELHAQMRAEVESPRTYSIAS